MLPFQFKGPQMGSSSLGQTAVRGCKGRAFPHHALLGSLLGALGRVCAEWGEGCFSEFPRAFSPWGLLRASVLAWPPSSHQTSLCFYFRAFLCPVPSTLNFLAIFLSPSGNCGVV